MVEEILKIDFKEVGKNLEKTPNSYKEKRAFIIACSKYFQIFSQPYNVQKHKWWSVLTCYYMPHLYFGKFG